MEGGQVEQEERGKVADVGAMHAPPPPPTHARHTGDGGTESLVYAFTQAARQADRQAGRQVDRQTVMQLNSQTAK